MHPAICNTLIFPYPLLCRDSYKTAVWDSETTLHYIRIIHKNIFQGTDIQDDILPSACLCRGIFYFQHHIFKKGHTDAFCFIRQILYSALNTWRYFMNIKHFQDLIPAVNKWYHRNIKNVKSNGFFRTYKNYFTYDILRQIFVYIAYEFCYN